MYTGAVGNAQTVTKKMAPCCLKYMYTHTSLIRTLSKKDPIMYICTTHVHTCIGESDHHTSSFNQDTSINRTCFTVPSGNPPRPGHQTNQDTLQIRTPHHFSRTKCVWTGNKTQLLTVHTCTCRHTFSTQLSGSRGEGVPAGAEQTGSQLWRKNDGISKAVQTDTEVKQEHMYCDVRTSRQCFYMQ